MRLPRKIEISGYTVEIRYKDKRETDDCFADYDPNKRRITIARGLSPARKKEFLIHEFLHFLEDIYRIDITEENVSCLALGILQLLNNKKIGWEL